MSDCFALSPFDGGALFDRDGALVGVYSRETGRGMFAHALFADERTCEDMSRPAPKTDFECSECGFLAWHCRDEVVNGEFGFCPGCGCKVVDADD